MIAVVPTIRPDLMKDKFIPAWEHLFAKHGVQLIVVEDSTDKRKVRLKHFKNKTLLADLSIKDIMGEDQDLIYNHHSGVGTLGFAYIAKNLPNIKTIMYLSDDLVPVGDPIQDHLDTLDKRFPISWFSTASEYMRGFPYGVREEAECVLSHGVWGGVADWDAPTQLINGNPAVDFYQGPIPRGVFTPICEMNIAFKRKLLPYTYFAPNTHGVERGPDILMGINIKKACDEHNWAIASGYSTVFHERASNVYKNLQRESKFIELNETYWQGNTSDPYFKEYLPKNKRWEKLIKKWIQ